MENFVSLLSAFKDMPFLDVVGIGALWAAWHCVAWLRKNVWSIQLSNEQDRLNMTFEAPKQACKRCVTVEQPSLREIEHVKKKDQMAISAPKANRKKNTSD